VVLAGAEVVLLQLGANRWYSVVMRFVLEDKDDCNL
jgi:hypothetical protein